MTSNFRTLTFSKFLLASFAALALTGCLPIPIFEVTPSTARAGTELTFDASGSVVSNVPEDNVAVGWSWSFGDGETTKGEVVTHTYDKPGTYTVKLTVTDSAGREASVEEPLVVKEALVTTPEDTTEDSGSTPTTGTTATGTTGTTTTGTTGTTATGTTATGTTGATTTGTTPASTASPALATTTKP